MGLVPEKTGFDGIQHYIELYYRIATIDGDSIPNVLISPDLQFIANPSGHRAIDPVVVYGLRVQASF